MFIIFAGYIFKILEHALLFIRHFSHTTDFHLIMVFIFESDGRDDFTETMQKDVLAASRSFELSFILLQYLCFTMRAEQMFFHFMKNWKRARFWALRSGGKNGSTKTDNH